MIRKTKVSIIGCGKTGKTIGYLLNKSSGYKVAAVACTHDKTAEKAAKFIGSGIRHSTDISDIARQGEIIFITTPDDRIEKTFRTLCKKKAFSDNALVIHCSGNFSSDILKAKKSLRLKTGTIHPLQTFADPKESIKRFKGITCTYESDSSVAAKQLLQIIKALKGTSVRINKRLKPIYHASGVIASNYLATLFYLSRKFLTKAGFPEKLAERALLQLVEGTVKNLKSPGLPHALTGPISRGDIKTIKTHIKMIQKYLPQYEPAYKLLGAYTTELALLKGSIGKIHAKELRKILTKTI